ncbi:hypothetical protein AVEN_83993-1 [Araneus ventricosus]|uniref:Uncharacterized protein n=1 Tax=Araneus ventricosus TaxID=182803 RepID=A0A4Y2BR58_ARAVE|nr:hypothetical protein AVEN_83993-1 [Araneus ventricosus]
MIEGITPLHIKAQMESMLVRVGRLRRDCNWEGPSFLYQSFQQPSPPIIIHPDQFDLEDRVSIVPDPPTASCAKRIRDTSSCPLPSACDFNCLILLLSFLGLNFAVFLNLLM